MILTALIATAWLSGLSAAAPTKKDNALDVPRGRVSTILDQLCSSKRCLFGEAMFDLSSFSCSCPAWSMIAFPDLCGTLQCDNGEEPFYSVITDSCYCGTMEDWYNKADDVYSSIPRTDQKPVNDLHRRQTPTSSALPINTAVPTFIPPPNQDITPDLIQQSLSVQPQNTALVSSMVPYFRDGVIQIYLQLDGPVPTTLVVNCSTSLPCGTIGLVNPQPNLALVPLVVNQGQGQPQTVIADCQCIAVNMYNPRIVTYWIQKLSDGSVYSILGNNVVVDIDKMNTTQSTALTLATLSQGTDKRSIDDNVACIEPERRQIWSVQCDRPCPFYHMNKIKGTDGYCGCMFNDTSKKLDARALIEPDLYNAKMTEEACAAMTCFNNGGSPTPALFHPFHLTCWCVTQPYIESNPSAWSASSGTTSS